MGLMILNNTVGTDTSGSNNIWTAIRRYSEQNLTSRDRPKSAPYPRLKNSKKTPKCQVLFYSTRKSKFFEKKILEKITYSKKWTEWRAGAR